MADQTAEELAKTQGEDTPEGETAQTETGETLDGTDSPTNDAEVPGDTPDPLATPSERVEMETQTMSLEEQQAIATSNKWHRLGEKTIVIETPLGSDDLVNLAGEMSETMMQIEKMQAEKKAFDSAIGERIKAHQSDAIAFAHQIKDGANREERLLPCFLDTETKERVYVDPDTKEVLLREDAKDEDQQLALT